MKAVLLSIYFIKRREIWWGKSLSLLRDVSSLEMSGTNGALRWNLQAAFFILVTHTSVLFGHVVTKEG